MATVPGNVMARRPPQRVLLIQLRRLGDVVLSTALLEDLRRAFPDAQLDYLVGQEAAPLVAGHPLVHERIVFDAGRTMAMWREIRARGYDWVVDLQGSLRTALLTRASGARVRLGWRIGAWRLFYTQAQSRVGRKEYVPRQRARILEQAGVPLDESAPPSPRIYLAEEELLRGERDARSVGAMPDGRRVGMLLSTREPAKDWSVEKFGATASALVRDGVSVLIFQSPGDGALVARMRVLAPGVVVLPVMDVRRVAGVLARCCVFVSGDTGPAHMADALGVPRVTMFGPTSPVYWTSGAATTVALSGPNARIVPLGDRAKRHAAGEDFMAGIEPEQVVAAVQRLLHESPCPRIG